MEFYRVEYERLTSELEQAFEESTLPEMPSARAAINDLLVRLRLNDSRSAVLNELTAQAQELKLGY